MQSMTLAKIDPAVVLKKITDNPVDLIKEKNNGCIRCLQTEELRALSDAIQKFLNENKAYFLEFRHDAMLQSNMEKLYRQCDCIRDEYNSRSCLGRKVGSFIGNLCIFSFWNPPTKIIRSIKEFQAHKPSLPLEIIYKIIARKELPFLEKLKLARVSRIFKPMVIHYFVKEMINLNQCSFRELGIWHAKLAINFLKWLGEERKSITCLNLEDIIIIDPNELTVLLKLAPDIASLAINSRRLTQKHLSVISELAHLRYLKLYKNKNITDSMINELFDKLNKKISTEHPLTLLFHNNPSQAEIQWALDIKRARQVEESERRMLNRPMHGL